METAFCMCCGSRYALGDLARVNRLGVYGPACGSCRANEDLKGLGPASNRPFRMLAPVQQNAVLRELERMKESEPELLMEIEAAIVTLSQ